MAAQCFESLLSDDQMLAQLQKGETFSLKVSKWQLIERQIERLGFGESYIVTQVEASHGKQTRVTPASQQQSKRAA